MLTALLAVRSSWIILLVLIVGISLVWFLVRVVVDSVKWFKEEIIDDFREHRKKSKEAREAKRKTEEDKGEA